MMTLDFDSPYIIALPRYWLAYSVTSPLPTMAEQSAIYIVFDVI
ncbi:MAG: hypothetical protein WCG98_03780 [bacterium]